MQTWNGKGDATEGDFLPAADVVFTIDIDGNTGEEMVTVSESKLARRQGDVLIDLPDCVPLTLFDHLAFAGDLESVDVTVALDLYYYIVEMKCENCADKKHSMLALTGSHAGVMHLFHTFTPVVSISNTQYLAHNLSSLHLRS